MADPKSLTVRAQGLQTAQSQIGDGPGQGMLTVADNIVISRQNLWEQRRGMALTASISGAELDYVSSYGNLLWFHDSGTNSGYLFDINSGVTQSMYGTYAQPSQGHLRTFESNGNFYISAKGGLTRLDRTLPQINGSPLGTIPAGSPPALDVSASMQPAGPIPGQAMPGDSQVAYRFTFINTDNNSIVHEGSPSGRAIVVSPLVVGSPGNVIRTSNVVNVTASNTFVVGEYILVGNEDSNFASGVFQVTSATTSSFSYTQTAANATNISYISFKYQTRDVKVGSTIPAQVSKLPQGYGYATNPYRFRVYRSQRSPDSFSTPSDDLQLVYEGPAPAAFTAVSMSRLGSTVTITGTADATGTNILPGETVYVPFGYPGGSGSTFVMYLNQQPFGNSSASLSADGINWSLATLTSTLNMNSIAASNTTFVAVGSGTSTTSSDGDHWTLTSSIPAGNWKKVIYDGKKFIAAGQNASLTQSVITSSDGANWSSVYPLGYLFGKYLASGSRDTNSAYWTFPELKNPPLQTLAFNGKQYITAFTCKPRFTGIYDYNDVSIIVIATSADGITWGNLVELTVGLSSNTAMQSANTPLWIPDLQVDYNPNFAWDGNRWVMTYGTGQLLSGLYAPLSTMVSADGINWSPIFLNYPHQFDVYCTRRPVPASDGKLTSILAVISGSGTQAFYLPNTENTYWQTGTINFSGSSSSRSISFLSNKFFAYGGYATSSNGIDWSSATGSPYGSYSIYPVEMVQLNASTTILPGYYNITAAGGTSMSFVSSGGGLAPTAVSPQTITPITVAVIDSTPDNLLQANLYTNGDITQQNDTPPDSADVVKYRSTTFYASPQRPASIAANLISVAPTGGLQLGDTVYVGAGSIVAATIENPLSGTFKLFTSSLDPNQNISDTVASIIRTINIKQASLGCYAVETSVQNGYPGSFIIVASSPLTDLIFSVSNNTTAWSPSTPQRVSPKRDVSLLAFSKVEQPEAVPVLNTINIGSPGKKILRLAPLRDGIVVMKEDGTFWLTGLTPPFDVQPLLPNLILKAPETVAFLADTIYALTNQGFVALSNQGREIISLKIDDKIQPLLTPDMLSTTELLAFGLPYESERAYHVWCPTSSSDKVPTQAFTFNALPTIQAWTKRTDMYRHALVSPADNRLWAVSGSGIYKERKSNSYLDYADSKRGIISMGAPFTPPLSVTVSPVNVIANANVFTGVATTSLITAMPTGGVPPYTYNWPGGNTPTSASTTFTSIAMYPGQEYYDNGTVIVTDSATPVQATATASCLIYYNNGIV